MKTPPSYAKNRLQVVPILTQKFMRDVEVVLEPFDPSARLRIIEHLILMVETFKTAYEGQQEGATEKLNTQEEVLYKEFGKTLMPYVNKHFHEYFYLDSVLLSKDVFPQEEYDQLEPANTLLSDQEYRSLLQICHNALSNAKRFLYLGMEPSAAEAHQNKEPESEESLETNKEFTKARQLLAIYVLLKAGFNVEHRDGQSVANVARLAHLLTGTRFTSIQNSDIYKKYRLMPEYKQGEALLEDLRFIRPFFEALQLTSTCTLIDDMITTEKKSKRR